MSKTIESGLHLLNDSRPQGDGWWQWSVWVGGSREALKQVGSVTYHLHPTFPEPVREVRNAKTRFRLRGSGWGEFAITADLRFRDGSTRRLERWLELRGEEGQSGADPKTQSERRPRVFVSHSVADGVIVHSLQQDLEREGIEVWTEGSLGSGGDWDAEVRQSIASSDLVLAVVSDPPSRWVEEEARQAMDAGRHVVPLVIGSAEMPASLRKLEALKIESTRGVRAAADAIVARVKDIVTPEEA